MAPPTLTAPPPTPAAEPKTTPAQQLRTSQDLFIRRWGEMGATWGIIRRLHKRGERREYFESLHDVWEIFSIIATERKRREMDPVLETIKQCQAMLDAANIGKAAANQETVKLTRQRLGDMVDSS